MTFGKPWHYILISATLGLAVTAAGYMYALEVFHWNAPTQLDITVTFVSVILCPPSLLFAWCIDCEVGTNSGVAIYFLSGVLNAVLYGLVGAWFGYRRKANRPAS